MKISLFESAKNTKPQYTIVFEQYLENVKNGHWQDAVINVRRVKQSGTKEEYQAAKALVPAVTASGLFSYRNIKGLESHSGFIAIDIDAQDNADGIEVSELAADIYTYAIHRSIGGDGWVVYVRIDTEKHLESFLGLEEYYLNHYKICIDSSCKDVSRLRYVSWDIDLVVNEKAKVFKQYISAKKVEPQGRIYTQQVTDIEHIINQCRTTNTDLTANYADWIKIGMAFAKEYGEAGRSYFHDVSCINSGYDATKTDRKFDNLLKTNKGIGLGSFVWLAQQAGLETKTPTTILIETVAKSRRNMVGQNGGFKDTQQAEDGTVDYLEKMEGIAPEISRPIAKLVMAMQPEQIKGSLVGDIVKDTECYVKMLPLRFNEVTNKTEYKGEDINDRIESSLFIDALLTLKGTEKGKTLSSELFKKMIYSDRVERYNPFKEFFNKHGHHKPLGLVGELIDCVKMKGYTDEERDFLQLCITKWLLGIIASMHGDHSVMCLVLCSSMGKGKTKFFSELLPEELQKYYTESTLDREKDSDLEMSEHLVICDDEFSGKNKKDANKFKSLLSKRKFNTRKAYATNAEKYKRIAVLCGTSNEEDILADLEGNRRIVPINIHEVDLKKYKAIDKTLLMIELYYMYLAEPDFFILTPEDIAQLKSTAERNEESCMEMEAFYMYFDSPENQPNYKPIFCTPTEIKVKIEQNSKTLKISLKKLGAVLKKIGIEKTYEYRQRTKVYGYTVVEISQ